MSWKYSCGLTLWHLRDTIPRRSFQDVKVARPLLRYHHAIYLVKLRNTGKHQPGWPEEGLKPACPSHCRPEVHDVTTGGRRLGIKRSIPFKYITFRYSSIIRIYQQLFEQVPFVKQVPKTLIASQIERWNGGYGESWGRGINHLFDCFSIRGGLFSLCVFSPVTQLQVDSLTEECLFSRPPTLFLVQRHLHQASEFFSAHNMSMTVLKKKKAPFLLMLSEWIYQIFYILSCNFILGN